MLGAGVVLKHGRTRARFGEGADGAGRTGRPDVEVSISIRTILLVGGAVALAWAVALGRGRRSPPVRLRLERRRPLAGGGCDGATIGWSRGLCSTVLVLALVIAIGAVVLILSQAISSAVRGFGNDLPQIVDQARHSGLGTSSTTGVARSTR